MSVKETETRQESLRAIYKLIILNVNRSMYIKVITILNCHKSSPFRVANIIIMNDEK